MLTALLVEDNFTLRAALATGLEATGEVRVSGQAASGEEALVACLAAPPDAVLMDVQLAGEMNGIEAAVAIRREHPRMPVVFIRSRTTTRFTAPFCARASSATMPTCARATTCCRATSSRCCATPPRAAR